MKKRVRNEKAPKKGIQMSLWHIARRLIVITIGSVIAALGYSIFQVPYNIVAGGVSGIGIIINYFTGWPVGIMFLFMNIPLLIIGFFNLGRFQFLIYTLLGVIVFSVASDMFVVFLPNAMEEYPVTDDKLLSAIYAGIVYGIGNGMVFRAGGTLGGTNIIGRILQRKTGIPLSQVYLYSDGAVIVFAGAVFGWELALHGLLTLFIIGMATDFVMEGPSMVRTATIISNYPDELIQALMVGLQRGSSKWNITGGYTGQTRSMVWCTINRSQVQELKQIVAKVDPDAFLVIGNAHQALGSGFLPLKGKE